jgi:hypothetical protein
LCESEETPQSFAFGIISPKSDVEWILLEIITIAKIRRKKSCFGQVLHYCAQFGSWYFLSRINTGDANNHKTRIN